MRLHLYYFQECRDQNHEAGNSQLIQILNAFEEAPVAAVCIEYDWNKIMMEPKLVCYDKSQWKTLQQLNNWNREWNQLFTNCFFLNAVSLDIRCSWMDKPFAQQLLGGVSKVPNIKYVRANFSSKNKDVEDILQAVSKAKIFERFECCFKQLC